MPKETIEQKEALSLEQVLKHLETFDPDTKEFIDLLLIEAMDFETPEYQAHPETALYCSQSLGLDDIINELIVQLQQLPNQAPLNLLMKNLATALNHERPVSYLLLLPLFQHLNTIPYTIIENAKRWSMAHIQLTQTDQKRFLKACGMEENSKRGKGSHTHFSTSDNQIQQASCSTNTWAENIVKSLISQGMSLEIIAKACQERNIRFTIIQ